MSYLWNIKYNLRYKYKELRNKPQEELKWAILCKESDTVKHLLKGGVFKRKSHPNGEMGHSNDNMRYLAYCAKHNLIDIGKLLLKSNVDTYSKESAFLIAIDEYGYEFVQLLIDSDIEIDKRDSDGKTPLMRLLSKGKYINPTQSRYELVKLLIKNGADVNAKDPDGRSALICAIDQKAHSNEERINIIKLLISYGSKIEQKDKLGRTAVITAILENNIEAVTLLIEGRAKIDLNTEFFYSSGILTRTLKTEFEKVNLPIGKLLYDSGFMNEKDYQCHIEARRKYEIRMEEKENELSRKIETERETHKNELRSLSIDSAIAYIVDISRNEKLHRNTKIKEIGEELNKSFGFSGMVQVCNKVGEKLHGSSKREIESTWDGIGSWRG